MNHNMPSSGRVDVRTPDEINAQVIRAQEILHDRANFGDRERMALRIAELESKFTANVKVIEALRSAREWHLGDKWRNGSPGEQQAWRHQLDRYDAALARCGAQS